MRPYFLEDGGISAPLANLGNKRGARSLHPVRGVYPNGRNVCPLLFVTFCLSSFWMLPGRSETPLTVSRAELTTKIESGIDRLNELYWSSTLGIWLDRSGDDLRAHYEGRRNSPWWPSANAVEMLIDLMKASGTSRYDAMIESLYFLQKDHPERRERLVRELNRRHQWSETDEAAWQREQREPAPPQKRYYTDFQNEYLDDSGWWGIAWLKMYDRTGAAKYLKTAQTIHSHMAGNWRPQNGGGIVWCEDEDKRRPNAITNSLFMILSARLYQRTHEPADLEWAQKTLEWFQVSALYDGIAVVDQPGHHGDYWTYNQGAFIGALTSLFEATGNQSYLDQAVAVARTVLHQAGLTSAEGVFVEKMGVRGDAALFKGIFVRYLAQLREVLRANALHPEMALEIDRRIQISVYALLRQKLGGDGLFASQWQEPHGDETTSFNTQVSALTALIGGLPDQ